MNTSKPRLSSEAALFSFDYPPNDGGISRLCAEIVRAMRRRVAKVKVLTQTASTDVTQRDGLYEVRLPNTRPTREWQAFRWLRQNPPDGPLVCGTWYPEGLIAMMAGIRPLVILAHGSELMPAAARWRRPLWRAMLRRVCESADLVVANSGYTSKLVLAGAPKARVAAIPLGVDHLRFSPEGRERARQSFELHNELVISSVSRVHAYKGHEVVFEAIAGLPKRIRKDIVYLLAGKGPYEMALRARAEELGIPSNLRWLGFVSDTDLPNVYRASDLFVLCTREAVAGQHVEGFGLVFLEAQACGTPVVGTRTGGIPDAVCEGEGGWLIAQDDAEELGRILLNLAGDPAAFHLAGLAGRRRIERECTWLHYTERFITVLKSHGIPLV